VRCLCEACRQPRQPPLLASEEEFQRITGELPAYRPVGCEQCGYTGYRGRLPVIEYVEMTPPLRQALLTGGRSLATLKDAVAGHRRSMAMSAKAWIVSGMTTPVEVQKVLGTRFWAELAEEHGKEAGLLTFDAGQEGQGDKRLKVLLMSDDKALCTRMATALPYAVERVANETLAVAHIDQQGSVIALAIDSALCTGVLEDWMLGLRTALASSGLPALFVLREGSQTLQVLLDRFGAMHIDIAESHTEALPAAMNRLLQGVH
jgi:hypothetical protein